MFQSARSTKLKPLSEMKQAELATEIRERGGRPEYFTVPNMRAWLKVRRKRDNG